MESKKKKYSRPRIILGLALLFSLLNGCVKDFPDQFPSEYTWRPLLAFPIGEADFGLKIPHGFDTLLLQMNDSTGFPLWAELEEIPLKGGVGFDFQQVLGDRDEVNMVILRVNAYNGFPIEVEVQAYLEDSKGQVIDSLFDPLFLMSRGTLQAGGRTVLAAHTQEDIIFDEQRLDILLSTRRISFEGKLNSVSYFPEYTFKVQLGAIMGIVTDL